MKKLILITALASPLLLSGCLPGISEDCSGYGDRVNNAREKISKDTTECDKWPTRYDEAAQEGADQSKLDEIVANHESCLADLEEQRKNLQQLEADQENCFDELENGL